MTSPKRLYTVLALLILVALFLIGSSLYFKSAGTTSFVKKIVLEASVPLGDAVHSALGAVGMTWKRYVLLVGLEEKNRELEETVASLKREVNHCREMSLEYMRLRELLKMKSDLTFPSVAARVVGRNRASVFRTVLINKGTTDGIKAGFPVVAAEGVAGRIIEVSWNVSKVLLLVDYNSNIAALVQRNRCQGVLQGAGGSGCELKYVQRSEEVKTGDMVLTSGLAGVFPKGLRLGTVTAVKKEAADLFQKITVNPTVDIAKLEEVLVVVESKEGDR
jgi:rod shape-determining protein MreC